MTDLQRKLDNLLNDENALAYKETLRRLQSLKLPRDEQTTKLAAALKSGDFAQAKQELEKLQKKILWICKQEMLNLPMLILLVLVKTLTINHLHLFPRV